MRENRECIMSVRLFMHYSGKKAGLSSNENVLENNFGLFEARWCTNTLPKRRFSVQTKTVPSVQKQRKTKW